MLRQPLLHRLAQTVWRGLLLWLLLDAATQFPDRVSWARPAAQEPPSPLLISEVMAAPNAAEEELGEWIEIANVTSAPVDLNRWLLVNAGDGAWLIDQSIIVPPHGYVILARHADPARNGGIQPTFVYAGFSIANAVERLQLLDPERRVMDGIAWGDGTRPAAPTGASWERVTLDPTVDWIAAEWVAAHSPWPGSAGDLGSPGAPYTPPPTPSPTPTLSPTAAPTTPPTQTPPPDVPPRLYLSEIMIDPSAAADDTGEWVELHSRAEAPVNLTGWVLADDDNDHVVLDESWIEPGAYLVLGRSGDAAQNGGVVVQGVYSGLQLANEADELRLLAPWGVEVDRVTWGSGGLAAHTGASLERTGFDGGSWVPGHTAWPGSAGDLGSPGAAYSPAPTTTPPPPTATPSPTPMLTPTATPLPVAWPVAPAAGALQIDQVYGTGSDDEYIVLINQSAVAQALDGWRMGDAELPGKGEGMVRLPGGTTLAPGQRLVLGRDAAAFRARWGFTPDAVWAGSDGSVPLLEAERPLGTRDLALNNQGDEVLLLDPAGRLVDVLAYGDAAYQLLGLAGTLPTAGDQAYFRAPGATFPTVRDLRHRFLRSAPDPAATYSLPTPLDHAPVALDDGMSAWWGTLGAHSTFSADGSAPPHVLLAEAAGMGLDFVAVADTDRAPDDFIQAQAAGITTIPAWQWHSTAGPSAIVYGAPRATPLSWGDLFDHLAATNGLAQLPADTSPGNTSPTDGRTPLFAADDLYAPGGLVGLYERWLAAGQPLLPAGNQNPPLRGIGETRLRYTGLVAPDASPAALLAAMAARRGWLTSSPALWLTLRSTDGHWMGSEIAPGNELGLTLTFGDKLGEPVAVALWQDDHIIRQLDLPPADGRWAVTVPAVPGSFLYAVATQRDGDFAVTAPLYVAPAPGGRVSLNEALPAPNVDHNGDGAINTDDEFIELYNSGTAPLSLTSFQLQDAGENGRRFTFGPGRFIGAGEYLVLWRAESSLSLNDDGDGLWLVDAEGTEIDHVAWGGATRDHAYGRLPGSGDWRGALVPTPGRANEAVPVEGPPRPPKEPEFDPVDVADPRSPVFGQATGAPGSLALGKLRGLYAPVEFRGQVTVPPGLFNSAIYVAEPAGEVAGLGVQVYLMGGDFIPMQEGDWVLVRGEIRSFRGEMEIQLDEPGRAWRIGPGTPLLPLPVNVDEIGESLEGRLVTFDGVISGWQYDSLYLVGVGSDPRDEAAASVRVTVRSSLDWRRPYVQIGEQYRITGVVSQFGTKAPWNDGYRVLPRFSSDVVRLD